MLPHEADCLWHVAVGVGRMDASVHGMADPIEREQAVPWIAAALVVDLLAHLQPAEDVERLLAAASAAARDQLGAERALVLTVAGDRLTAEHCGALADPGSDRLRREVLSAPVPLVARTPEAVALTDAVAVTCEPGARSVLGERLGLRHPTFAPVAPSVWALGLLVVDGDREAVDPAAAGAFAVTVGIALERVLILQRNAAIAAELQHLTVSASGLFTELQRAPLTLEPSWGGGAVLSWDGIGAAGGRAAASGVLAQLSERELEVLDRLAGGRSNREIADELFLAPTTVKGHVARILRKLGAANRAEAVSRYHALSDARQP